MSELSRTQDITDPEGLQFQIQIDDIAVNACDGETVLSVLLAANYKQIMESNREAVSGAYCGMGVCHCCQVTINKQHKQKACQTLVQPNMQVETKQNRFKQVGV